MFRAEALGVVPYSCNILDSGGSSVNPRCRRTCGYVDIRDTWVYTDRCE